MKLGSIAAAIILCAISFSEGAPHKPITKSSQRTPGLEKIKHVVYFMQVNKKSVGQVYDVYMIITSN